MGATWPMRPGKQRERKWFSLVLVPLFGVELGTGSTEIWSSKLGRTAGDGGAAGIVSLVELLVPRGNSAKQVVN